MILCAAGDPGGSRVMLSVISELTRRALPCAVLNHGFLGRELPEQLHGCLYPEAEAEALMERAALFIFGSSATDILPLSLARRARARGLPIVHILDNWSTYRSRLETDGLEMLVPDIYTVIDKEAEAGAIAEGVPSSCMLVTGHPGLADSAVKLGSLLTQDRRQTAVTIDCPSDFIHLAFVNEPFRAVYGNDLQVEGHPGFTEDAVLAMFTAALRPYRERVHVSVLPHPKESTDAVSALWERARDKVSGRVVTLAQSRDILGAVDGVAGMASILLYEAWLMRLPVLSLQPGCKLASLRRYASLEGIQYTDSRDCISASVSAWLTRCEVPVAPVPRPELAMHAASPAKIAECVIDLLREEAKV